MPYELGSGSQEMVGPAYDIEKEARNVVRFVADRNEVIVNLGCGTNVFVRGLQRIGFRNAMGIDMDSDLVDGSRLRDKSAVVGDVLRLPLEDHSVTMVISYNLLDHFGWRKRARELAGEMDRVLNGRDGVVYLKHEFKSGQEGCSNVRRGLLEKGFVEVEEGIFTRPGHPSAKRS